MRMPAISEIEHVCRCRRIDCESFFQPEFPFYFRYHRNAHNHPTPVKAIEGFSMGGFKAEVQHGI
jgi:hypothetical protein